MRKCDGIRREVAEPKEQQERAAEDATSSDPSTYSVPDHEEADMSGPAQRSTAHPYVATPEDSPGFWQLGNLWRVMASGVKTGNAFCLIDQLVTPEGGGPCAHAHTSDEGLYVVSGHCTFYASGMTLSAGPGTFVAVPRYAQHAFTVDAPNTQLLNFYLPAGFELFVMGFAHPAEQNALPPPGVPRPPRRLVEQLSRDYGQIPVVGLPGVDRQNDDNMATAATPGAVASPFSRHAGSAPSYWHAGGLWTVLADGQATDGSYTLFEIEVPHGPVAPPQVHADIDEMFYVLQGEAEFLLGDRIRTASRGDLVFIPKGTVHACRILGDTARLLNLYTPSGFERSVEILGERTDARVLPPPGWTSPEVPEEQRARLFEDLGTQVIAAGDAFRR